MRLCARFVTDSVDVRSSPSPTLRPLVLPLTRAMRGEAPHTPPLASGDEGVSLACTDDDACVLIPATLPTPCAAPSPGCSLVRPLVVVAAAAAGEACCRPELLLLLLLLAGARPMPLRSSSAPQQEQAGPSSSGSGPGAISLLIGEAGTTDPHHY